MTQESDRPDAPADQALPDMTPQHAPEAGTDETGASAGPGLPILRLGSDMARLPREAELETGAGTGTERAEAPPPAPVVMSSESSGPDNGSHNTEPAPEQAMSTTPEPPEEDRAGSLPVTEAEPDSAETQSPVAQSPEAPEETPPHEASSEAMRDVAGPDLWAATSEEVAPDLIEDTAEPVLSPPPPSPARPRPACAAALFGKLPARGDFIARNMPRAVQRPFEDWLIPLVQETRSELGEQWTALWRGAGPWRFWIGADVLGGSWQRDLRKPVHEQAGTGGAMTGVLLPSADRHGRDFPLVLLLADPLARLMPPPVTSSPDRGWYDLCDELLYAARAGTEIDAVEAALDRLPGPFLPEGAEEMAALLDQRALWAQGTETLADGTSRIWPDIARADHHLAASHRSYWWQAPRAGAAQRVLTLAGLPDAGSFAFMLSQGYPETPATRSAPHPTR